MNSVGNNIGFDVLRDALRNIFQLKIMDEDIPFCINLQVARDDGDEQDVFENLDNIVVDKDKVYLTMYLPSEINGVRFDVDDTRNCLVVANTEGSVFKEFWFKMKIKQDTLEANFSNNVLELSFEVVFKNKQ